MPLHWMPICIAMSKLSRLDLTEGFIHLADYPFTYADAIPVSFTDEARGKYRGIEGQWNYTPKRMAIQYQPIVFPKRTRRQ